MRFRSGHAPRVVMWAVLVGAMAVTVGAQFTVNIPQLPKIKKTKPQPQATPETTQTTDTSTTAPTATGSTASSPTEAEDKPKAKGGCEDDVFYQVHNENIQKTIDQAKDYTPGSRDYYVDTYNDGENIYLKAALSAKKRASWEEEWKDESMKKCINTRLDELALAAEKTIGSYRPPSTYTFGTAAEKAVLKTGVNDLNQASAVYAVGLNSATWKIDKDEYGLPKNRFRYGMIYAKYPQNKYCTIIWVNLVQDYSGGGTYNDSEARFIGWEFAGCPAK